MKSEICSNRHSKHPTEYPYLGKSSVIYHGTSIVLFTSRRTGVVVHSTNANNPVGMLSDCWSEDLFDEYDGQVILSND